MTTNVFDASVGVLATDSRWSQRMGRWLVYVDDTGFHKIEVAAQAVFMFAGRGIRIQEWKSWIRTGADQNKIPAFEGICISAVDVNTRQLKISEGVPIVREGSTFAGSGATFAYSCWEANKDVMKCVDTAKAFDPATGGDTRHFNLETRCHNLMNNVFEEDSIQAVDKAILLRGTVMDITATNSGIPFKLSDLAASNDEVRALKDQFESGALSADAPSDAMYSDWTEEQKSRVKASLGEIFGW